MGEHYNILTVLIAFEKQVRNKELMNIKEKRTSLLLEGEISITPRTKSALCMNSSNNFNSIDCKIIKTNNEGFEKEGTKTGNTSKQTETEIIKKKITKDLSKQNETKATKRKPSMELKTRNISPFSKTERAKVSSSLNQTKESKRECSRPKTTHVGNTVKSLDRNFPSSKKLAIKSVPKTEMNKRNCVKYSCKDAEKIYLKNSGSLRYSHFYDTKKPFKWTMLRRLTNYGLDSVDLVSAANKPENLKLPSLICYPPLVKTTNRSADKSLQFMSKSKGN